MLSDHFLSLYKFSLSRQIQNSYVTRKFKLTKKELEIPLNCPELCRRVSWKFKCTIFFCTLKKKCENGNSTWRWRFFASVDWFVYFVNLVLGSGKVWHVKNWERNQASVLPNSDRKGNKKLNITKFWLSFVRRAWNWMQCYHFW